jgi:hypothetical protein
MTGKEQILSLLQSGAYTRIDIQSIVKMTTGGTNKAIKQLRDERRVYIDGWERRDGRSGNHLPLYRAGRKRDADPLPRLTKSETSKMYRRRHAAVLKTRRAARRGKPINPFAQLIWGAQ